MKTTHAVGLVMLALVGAFLWRTFPALAISTLALDPTTVECRSAFNLQITVGGLSSPGSTIWIDIVPGLSPTKEHSVIRFPVTDGVPPPSIAAITNVNVNGDEDGVVNSSITTTFKLFSESLPVGIFRVLVTDQDNSSAAAVFTITKSPTAQSVSGTVRSSSGAPVEGAVIEVMNEQNCMLCGAVTGSSGDFTIYLDEPGHYTLAAFKHGLLTKYADQEPTSIEQLAILAGQHVGGVHLVLFEGSFVISGMITDSHNSRTIGGVQIEGEGVTDDGDEYDSTILTNPDGTYFLPVLNGQWEVDVSGLFSKGYVGKPGALGIRTVSGANIPWQDASFPPVTALIYGTVKDAYDQPVRGEEIVYASTVFNAQTFETVANADESGYYVLGVFNAGWWIGADLDDICRDDIAAPSPEMVIATNNTATPHNIALSSPVQISGKITDNDGPVQGIVVSAFGDLCWSNFSAQATTDSRGEYTITKLPPGIYYLLAESGSNERCQPYRSEWWTSHGGTENCSSAEPIDATVSTVSNINFTLVAAGGISGRVTNTNGDPIRGISPSVMMNVDSHTCTGTVLGNTQTDEQGYYQICGIPTGTGYVVRAFNGSALETYIEQVYSNKSLNNCGNADPVTVAKGQITPGIDFILMRKYRSDFDLDGDVDGLDLYTKSTGMGSEIPLGEFASDFGIAQ